MSKALYRKWRPQGWEEVTAQDHVIQTLKNAVLNDRVAHAYLFAGPRGTGKTTTARLLAKAVNCLANDLAERPCNTCEFCLALNSGRFLDLIEIDAASNTSVDDVRDLRDKINFSPSQGRFKVYIIDEVHMLSTAAFNALLKTLEEPPPHAIFILATTEIHKIPATVLSRCQRHEFRRIPIRDIVAYLKDKSKDENIDIEEAVFTEIARQATGSLRDAISLLDQLTSTKEVITLNMAQKILGTATSLRVIEVVDGLIEKDTARGLRLINDALDGGADPRQFARQVVTYLRNILLYKMGNQEQLEVGEDIKNNLAEHADQLSMPSLLQAIEAFNLATTSEQASWHPGLGLELAFTNYLSEPPSSDKQPSDLIKPTPVSQPKQPAHRSQTSSNVHYEKNTKPEQKPVIKKSPIAEPKVEEKIENTSNKTKVESNDEGEVFVASGDEISLSDIQKAWPRIKAMVKQHNPRTEGLLNTSKLADVRDNTLILGFSSDTLKGMMEKEGNITLTTDILEEVFGKSILVKCIVTTHEGSRLPEDLQIEKDGMVSAATRDLGGRISSAKQDK